jgi:hypothetical protein
MLKFIAAAEALAAAKGNPSRSNMIWKRRSLAVTKMVFNMMIVFTVIHMIKINHLGPLLMIHLLMEIIIFSIWDLP